MAAKKKKQAKKKKAPRRFRFQLSLGEIAGIGIVFFCLFLWRFLLGIWAGQTILLPASGSRRPPAALEHEKGASGAASGLIRPRHTKKAVGR